MANNESMFDARKHKALGSWLVLAIATIAKSQDFAIVDARVVESDRTLSGAKIIVRGGRIVEVGSNVGVPSGLTVIDAKGANLYPGFIDAYATTGLKMPDAPAAAQRPSATASAPATMWDKNRAGIRARVDAGANLALADILEDAHKAGFTSALLAPFSGLARGQCVWTPLTDTGLETRPFGMVFSFRGGGGGGGYPGTTMASFALLRQTMYDARNNRLVGTGEKTDPDLKALAPSSIANGRAVFALDADNEVVRAHKFCEEFGLRLAIAGGRDAFRRAGWFAETKTPILVSIAIGAEPSTNPSGDGPPKAILEERAATWKERAMNVVKLEQAKAEYAFSSDGDSYGDFLANARKLVALGLPPQAALKAMTVAPAKILGVWNDAGSIAPGKRADFIVVEGEVFAENSKVLRVFVGGKAFDVANGGGR